MATTLLFTIALLLLAAFSAFGLVSRREGEARAVRVSFALAVATSAPLFAAVALPDRLRLGVLAGLGVLGGLAILGWFLPLGRDAEENGRPSRRVDERDIMFARARLRTGAAEYDSYYAAHPERRAGDDRTRALPGLLSPRAKKAEPVAFASARACFDLIETIRDEVDGPVAPRRSELSPAEATAALERLAIYYGARAVGVARLEDYHLYSHVGRGSGIWGEPISLDHRWAVAFTVEMDHATMAWAPEAPVVAESARQYVEGAKIAIFLARVIRSLGFPARAHIDGNYRVIAPLVACDAGLGEIGRMGILMTPRLGPRVRLGVVTTDMPLVPDEPCSDLSVIDFCSVCRKCAESCPTGALPLGDREPIDEGQRWGVDAEACFRYWNAVGTDCGVCMKVCPYSHPDNAAHNLVRWAIRRSAAARRVLLWMDDLFYGRRPKPPGGRPMPSSPLPGGSAD